MKYYFPLSDSLAKVFQFLQNSRNARVLMLKNFKLLQIKTSEQIFSKKIVYYIFENTAMKDELFSHPFVNHRDSFHIQKSIV